MYITVSLYKETLFGNKKEQITDSQMHFFFFNTYLFI